MKDRTQVCVYYLCHGFCSKGKKANIYGECVHCTKYEPRKGGAPAFKNTKRQRIEREMKKDIDF
jgi:hypothetical protein